MMMATILFVVALGFVLNGRKLRTREKAQVAIRSDSPLALMRGWTEVVKPLVFAAVGMSAAALVLAYFAFGGDQHLSVLQLGACLAVLGSYAYWFDSGTTGLHIVESESA